MEEKIYTNIPVREVHTTTEKESKTTFGFANEVVDEPDFKESNYKLSVEEYRDRQQKFLAFDEEGKLIATTLEFTNNKKTFKIKIRRAEVNRDTEQKIDNKIANATGGVIGTSSKEETPLKFDNIFSKLEKISGEGDTARYKLVLNAFERFAKADGTLLSNGEFELTGAELKAGGFWKSVKKFFLQIGGWIWNNGGREIYQKAVRTTLDKTREVVELGMEFLQDIIPATAVKDEVIVKYNSLFGASTQIQYENETNDVLNDGMLVAYSTYTEEDGNLLYNQLACIVPEDNENQMAIHKLVKGSGASNDLITFIKDIKPYTPRNAQPNEYSFILTGIAYSKIQVQFITINFLTKTITRIDKAVDISLNRFQTESLNNLFAYLDVNIFRPIYSEDNDYIMISSGIYTVGGEASTSGSVNTVAISRENGTIAEYSNQQIKLFNNIDSLFDTRIYSYQYNGQDYLITCNNYDNSAFDEYGRNDTAIPSRTVIELRKLKQEYNPVLGLYDANEIISRVIIYDPLAYYKLDLRQTHDGLIGILIGGLKFDNTSSEYIYAYSFKDVISPLLKEDIGNGVFGSTNVLFYDDEDSSYKYLSYGGTNSFLAPSPDTIDEGSNIELSFSKDYTLSDITIPGEGITLHQDIDTDYVTLDINASDVIDNEHPEKPANMNAVAQASKLSSTYNMLHINKNKKPNVDAQSIYNFDADGAVVGKSFTLYAQYNSTAYHIHVALTNTNSNKSNGKVFIGSLQGQTSYVRETSHITQFENKTLVSIDGSTISLNDTYYAQINGAMYDAYHFRILLPGIPTDKNIGDKQIILNMISGTAETVTDASNQKFTIDLSKYLPKEMNNSNTTTNDYDMSKYHISYMQACFLGGNEGNNDTYIDTNKVLLTMQINKPSKYSDGSVYGVTAPYDIYVFSLVYDNDSATYVVSQCDIIAQDCTTVTTNLESQSYFNIICGIKNYLQGMCHIYNESAQMKFAADYAMMYLSNGAVYEYYAKEQNWDAKNPVVKYRSPTTILGYEYKENDVNDLNPNGFIECGGMRMARLIFTLYNRIYSKDIVSQKYVTRYISSDVVKPIKHMFNCIAYCYPQQLEKDIMFDARAWNDCYIILTDTCLSIDGGNTWAKLSFTGMSYELDVDTELFMTQGLCTTLESNNSVAYGFIIGSYKTGGVGNCSYITLTTQNYYMNYVMRNLLKEKDVAIA